MSQPEPRLPDQIDSVRDEFRRLARRAGEVTDGPSRQETLEETVEELRVSLEELQAANEELRASNDQILAARGTLDAERKRYQDLFEFAPDGYLVTDTYGVIREANRAADALLNVAPGRLVGRVLVNFIPPDERRATRLRLLDARKAAGATPEQWEIRLTPHGDLPTFDASARVGAIRDARGKVVALRWLLRDVTPEKRADEEIRRLNAGLERRVADRTADLEAANREKDDLLKREQHAHAAAEAERDRAAFLAGVTSALATSLDYPATLTAVARLAVPRLGDWCIVYVREGKAIHRAAVAHARPEAERLLRDLDRVFPIDLESPASPVAALRDGRTMVSPVVSDDDVKNAGGDDLVRLVRSIGADCYLAVPLIARGATFGQLAFGRAAATCPFAPSDVTLAEELARRAALAIDNARLFQQAQEAVRTNELFISSVTHDLRGPLTNLKGYAQLVQLRLPKQNGAWVQEVVAGLRRIDAAATKIDRMIEDLSDLARLHLGQPLQLHRRLVDLVALVQEVIADYQESANGRPIQLSAATPRLIGDWDPVRLERVIGNLLSNAVKYSPRGSPIDLTVGLSESAPAPTARLTVTDRGIGIPAADLPRLFERYHRGSNVSAQTIGSGVGLASSQQIVEQMGGTISVKSEEGKGSTFAVLLPLSVDVKGEDQPP